MKSPKERVQEYVRERCGLDGFTVKNVKPGDIVSKNHKNAQPLPVRLHHYLTVLGDSYAVDGSGYLLSFVDGEWTNVSNGNGLMQFSLTDGHPSTEKDWELLANILGVGV